MKIITMYELLGMIKDGKAPKKIKFNNICCYYRECKNEYVDYTNKPIIQWDYVVMNSLNDEVEILEEEKKALTLNDIRESYGLLRIEEKKIPEKIKLSSHWNGTFEQEQEYRNKRDDEIAFKINSIIDYLKSKGE